MFRFLTFLIFIILIQKLLKTLKEQQKQQQEPTEDEIKNYFQSLGFPPPEELPVQSKPESPEQPPLVKREIKKPEVEVSELKPVKIKAPCKEIIEETKEELPDFSEDKLEQGIILSEILSPPKAYQNRRGGGIGIRAGLKNRWPQGREGSTPSLGTKYHPLNKFLLL